MDILQCCDVCGEGHQTERCPELGLDTASITLNQVSTRARLTLPPFVEVVDNGDGLVGVVARQTIPQKTQLGPYEAKRTTHIFDDTNFFTLKLISKDNSTVCLDTTDENECNWLCLVRAALSPDHQNLMAYQMGPNIFYSTVRDIMQGEELQVWYTQTFARKLGKPPFPDGVSKVLLGHRIEPLVSDIVDTEDFLSHDTGSEMLSEPDTAKIGTGAVVKRAIYCPRCGNTFQCQSAMVRHLREHVLSASGRGRPRRGRPRIHPVMERDIPSTVVRRGRGRPRKSAIIPDHTNTTLNMDATDKTDRKRKMSEVDDDSEKFEDQSDVDDDDDDEDEEEEGEKSDTLVIDEDGDDDADKDYHPMKAVRGSSRRVQPRRSQKGKFSKYGDEFVLGRVVKKLRKPDKAVKDIKDGGSGKKTDAQGGITGETDNTADVMADGEQDAEASVPVDREVRERGTGLDVNATVGRDGEIGSNAAIVMSEMTRCTDLQDVNEQGMEIQDLAAFINTTNSMEAISGQLANSEQASAESRDCITENNEEGDSYQNKTDQFVPQNTSENMDGGEVIDSERLQDNETATESTVIMIANDPTVAGEDQTTPAETDSEDMPDEVSQSLDSSDNVIMYEETGDEMYCCVLCGDKFTKEEEAVSHFMVHNKGPVTCKKCSKQYQSTKELHAHLKVCGKDGGDKNGPKDSEARGELKFVCDICQQAFRTALYLYRHMVMHTDMFNCITCKKTFSRKDSLHKHVLKCCPKMIDKYKFFACETCSRVFAKLSGKLNHMKVCTSVKCADCNKVFASRSELDSHKCGQTEFGKDGINNKYSCGTCSKTFQSLYYLKQHTLLHKNLHTCERCGKSLPSSEDLKEHQGLCVTIDAIKSIGVGTCDKCSMLFNNCKVFREHYLSHTHPYQCDKCLRRFIKIGTLSCHDCQATTGGEFTCDECRKSFKTQVNLDRHKKEHGCMKYECSICHQQFTTKSQANEHQCGLEATEERVITQLEEKEMCSDCGKSFSTRSNLTKHMKLHGDKLLPCPHCDKRFHLSVYLKEHITCVHFNICKYQCTECGKMLKSKTGLIAHTKIFHRTDCETFKCPKCPKSFKQKGNLRTHMYSHSTEKKFFCDTCDRAFKYPDQLSRHKLEHKVSNKISCSQCEKEFCREYELRKHIQIYHSGYMYVCGVCSAKCGHRHTLVRHYKRKHSHEVHLLSEDGYINSLLKQVHDSFDNSELNGEKSNGPIANESLQITTVTVAAEALHSLAQGNMTGHLQLHLQEKGLMKNESIDTSQVEQRSILVSHDGEVISQQGSILQQEQIIHDGTVDTISGMSMEGLGMIQNSDGSISINGIAGIPQALGGEGQIVILQIVDPEMAKGLGGEVMQGEVIQHFQGQQLLNGETVTIMADQDMQAVNEDQTDILQDQGGEDVGCHGDGGSCHHGDGTNRGGGSIHGDEIEQTDSGDVIEATVEEMDGTLEEPTDEQGADMIGMQALESDTIIIDTIMNE